jgi:hypothetical protein
LTGGVGMIGCRLLTDRNRLLMDASAPWKTEETSSGLPKPFIFPRFGGRHLLSSTPSIVRYCVPGTGPRNWNRNWNSVPGTPYRVFYDVDDAAGRVIVRAVRRKPPHKTTEEIL